MPLSVTYTTPEGVTIGSFTADSLPTSFNAPTGADIGYKIYGTTPGAGVETENLWDGNYENCYFDYNDGKFYSPDNTTLSAIVACSPSTTYTIRKVEAIGNRFRIGCFSSYPTNGDTGQTLYASQSGTDTLATVTTTNDASYLVIFVDFRFGGGIGGQLNVVPGSTAPDHYIPHGYKLPLTVETGEQTQELSVYIGDSQLSDTEYVDYESGKIYKLQEGELTPTDPPLPLPAITASGETTITTTETLGDIELSGDWLAIMGSTDQSELEIDITVDADSYIAMLTIDDDPTIQVFDTFTMPSSAGSFTLQVVSWGREQYTDTVYNALT